MKHDNLWVMCAAAGATVAVLAGAATAALAQQRGPTTTIVGERANTEIVSYRDLDLASSKGKRLLHARVDSAVRNVCRPDASSSFGDHIFNECASVAMEGARPQIARAVQRSRQIAATGWSNIPMVAIAISAQR